MIYFSLYNPFLTCNINEYKPGIKIDISTAISITIGKLNASIRAAIIINIPNIIYIHQAKRCVLFQFSSFASVQGNLMPIV